MIISIFPATASCTSPIIEAPNPWFKVAAWAARPLVGIYRFNIGINTEMVRVNSVSMIDIFGVASKFAVYGLLDHLKLLLSFR
jgi:hypothetical protein